MTHRLSLCGCLLVLGCLFTGCGDEIGNVIDCAHVCNRYKDCFNSNYDVSSCTNQCQSDAGASSDKEARLEKCNSCIGDRSCVSATFNCATDCAGVIPSQ